MSKVLEIAHSIAVTKKRGHSISYCEISEAEYGAICRETPWWLDGEFAIDGVDIRVRKC